MRNHYGQCRICDSEDKGFDALVSVVMVQMDGKFNPSTVPLCSAHLTQAETVLSNTKAISGQSPAVVINLRGICGNGDPGMG